MPLTDAGGLHTEEGVGHAAPQHSHDGLHIQTGRALRHRIPLLAFKYGRREWHRILRAKGDTGSEMKGNIRNKTENYGALFFPTYSDHLVTLIHQWTHSLYWWQSLSCKSDTTLPILNSLTILFIDVWSFSHLIHKLIARANRRNLEFNYLTF